MTHLRKMTLRAGLALTALGFATVPAYAITYVGNRTVGAATAQLSITTDNTIGVLTAANVTDWSIALTAGMTTVYLFGPLSGNNSGLRVFGTLFSATASDLLFDFGGADAIIFDNFSFSGDDAYCLDGAAATATCVSPPGTETVFLDGGNTAFETVRPTGVQVLASVNGAVPEPASWAMMIAGFGLAGAALRRRQRVSVSYA